MTSEDPSLGCMTPDGYPYLTNIEQGGCPAPITAVATIPAARLEKQLPQTGAAADTLAFFGIFLLVAGIGLRLSDRIGRR